jgi:uncharacterized membrane protein
VDTLTQNATADRSKSAQLRLPRQRGAKWIVPTLILLGVLPVALGIVHLATVVAGIDVSAKALYFLSMPVPIALHVIGAAIYVLLGPLQFASGLRRRAPHWHRRSGRLLVVAGLFVAVSALWMTITLPHQAGGGELLYVARLLFGAAMIASIGLGFAAIQNGNVPAHRRWMTRAYAIGLGAATQIPVLMVAEIVAGHPSELMRALHMASAWVINLLIAEWRLRR